MLKAFIIALGAAATGWAAPPDESSSRVAAALSGPWSELSITAMVIDPCMGDEHFGIRLKREKDRITIARMEMERGTVLLGPARELSKSQLDEIVRTTASHHDAALASKSLREALHERIAHLPDEDQLKEIARVSRTANLKALAISIAFGDRVTDQCFENEFGDSGGAAFAEWVASVMDRNPPSK